MVASQMEAQNHSHGELAILIIMQITKEQLHQAKKYLFLYLRDIKKYPNEVCSYEAADAANWMCFVLDIITESTWRRIDRLIYAYRHPNRVKSWNQNNSH